jgi:hypothetical protein
VISASTAVNEGKGDDWTQEHEHMLEETRAEHQVYGPIIEGTRFETLEVLGPPAPLTGLWAVRESPPDGAYAPRKAFSAAASSAPSSPRGNRWP